MEKKYFVYSLLINDNVVYIGCTVDVYRRYVQHIAGTRFSYNSTPIINYLRELIKEGIYPDLNIIHYLPEKEAKKLEADLIRGFSQAGHKLHNSTHNYCSPTNKVKNAPLKPTHKEILKSIRYKRDIFIYHVEKGYVVDGKYVAPPPNPFINNIQ